MRYVLVVRPAWAHSCGSKSHRELITASEAKRNCARATEHGEEAWNVGSELRPISSTGITTFLGNTGLSATPMRPACPSPASGWSLRSTTHGASRVASVSLMHAVVTTRAEPRGACFALFPRGDSPPRNSGGSASALRDTGRSRAWRWGRAVSSETPNRGRRTDDAKRSPVGGCMPRMPLADAEGSGLWYRPLSRFPSRMVMPFATAKEGESDWNAAVGMS